MTIIDTVVIGAGHAGLAVSRLLTGAGREHVVLDRGRVGERWRTERWDSLHLLTPNWMTRLPGWSYGGPEPEGYMSARRLVRHLERYAASFAAPVIGDTTVEDLSAGNGRLDGLDRRWVVGTDHGNWRARHVIIATGPYSAPHVPSGLGRTVAADVLASSRYRTPARLAPGGVLVIGASSSGVQIADELARAGRRVVLAVGRHTRMPRRYRGLDIFWWLHSTGRLARTIDDLPDPSAARREPSLQLIGRGEPEKYAPDLDLASLQACGVRLIGRLDRIAGSTAHFRSDLADTLAAADLKMRRFLDRVDEYVEHADLADKVWPGVRPRPVEVSAAPNRLDLRREGIGSVLLATGYRPNYPWLQLPITAPDGTIRQYRGVTPAPGVYIVGQRFQHRRDSGLIDGARHDARAVVHHLLAGSGEAALVPSEESAA
jgi:putative flavoprotein involved in K+ transport